MNIISLLGSPRKNGNTATLLNKVLDGILDKNNAKNETIFLQDKNIKPCIGCNLCKTNKEKTCIIKDDDMTEIVEKIINSDVIIIASPIYWWSLTAQTKLLIDRLYGVNFSDKKLDLKSKKVILLMTYEGELPNSGPETTEKLFKEICSYMNVNAAGVLGVCTGKCEVKDNLDALNKAYKFGQDLNL